MPRIFIRDSLKFDHYCQECQEDEAFLREYGAKLMGDVAIRMAAGREVLILNQETIDKTLVDNLNLDPLYIDRYDSADDVIEDAERGHYFGGRLIA